jgi:excisionase family DNA binding protein
MGALAGAGGNNPLQYIAKELGAIKRQYVENGIAWPMRFEALRLLAVSESQRPSKFDSEPDPGECLVVDYRTAARLLSISESTLSRLIRRGEIPTVMIGDPRIVVADLETYIENRPRRRAS